MRLMRNYTPQDLGIENEFSCCSDSYTMKAKLTDGTDVVVEMG